MSIYKKWVSSAYDSQGNTNSKTWDKYLPLEQKIYEEMLKTKNPTIKGNIAELSEKYNMTPEFFLGFLDGISAALEYELDLENIGLESEIDLEIDFENLYKKMVEYKAYHLISLPEWGNIFAEDQREIFYKEQKNSRTIVNENKTGRNEPCPCGSGKKYKRCCL